MLRPALVCIHKTARPDVPNQYVPAVLPDRVLEVVSEPHCKAMNNKYNEAAFRCKENGVTVQAAIPATGMLASLLLHSNEQQVQ